MGGGLLFALSCNVDTLLLAGAYGLRGVSLSGRGRLILAAVTTAVTALSLLFGALTEGLFQGGNGRILGGAVLMGMGLWVILDYLRRPAGAAPEPAGGDSLGAMVALGAALAVNNAGAGVCAGAVGVSAFWGSCANFAVTLFCLPFGEFLARHGWARGLEPYALPLSGGLLVLLGALELWG
ncbi:MAG: sporulation protein [Oscillospiraceae bacterium]